MTDDAILSPGQEVEYTVTYLSMEARPSYPVPHAPAGHSLALVAADDPPVEYFLYLYAQVGAEYEWTDRFEQPREELEAFVKSSDVYLHTLLVDGWPGGFFMLDSREAGVCDLGYFGLVPQAISRGLGRWLLGTAIHAGWDLPWTSRMTVNTNTLDHPRALGLYQRMGFVPERRELHRRRLTGPRPAPGG